MEKEIENIFYVEFREHKGDCINCMVYLSGSKDTKSRKIKADLKLDTNNTILMQKVEILKFRDKFYINVRYPKRGGYNNEKTWIVTDLLDEYDMAEGKNVNHLFDTPQMIKKTSFFQPKSMSKSYSAKDTEIYELKETNSILKKENKGLNQLASQLFMKISKLENENEMLTEQLNNLNHK